MEFKEKLEVSEIAGLTIQIVEQLGKAYTTIGHADPLLYNALKIFGELADQYKVAMFISFSHATQPKPIVLICKQCKHKSACFCIVCIANLFLAAP